MDDEIRCHTCPHWTPNPDLRHADPRFQMGNCGEIDRINTIDFSLGELGLDFYDAVVRVFFVPTDRIDPDHQILRRGLGIPLAQTFGSQLCAIKYATKRT